MIYSLKWMGVPPIVNSWRQTTLLNEIIQLKRKAYSEQHCGPYTLRYSKKWQHILEENYVVCGLGSCSIKVFIERILEIEDLNLAKLDPELEEFEMYFDEVQMGIIE